MSTSRTSGRWPPIFATALGHRPACARCSTLVPPAALAEGLDHLLGACRLQSLLHVGAGPVERADNWAAALDAVVGVPGSERPKAPAALQNRIAAGTF